MPNENSPLKALLEELDAQEKGTAPPPVPPPPSPGGVVNLRDLIAPPGSLQALRKELDAQIAESAGNLVPELPPEIDVTTGLNGFHRIVLSFLDDPNDRVQYLKDQGISAGRLETGDLVYLNPETKKWTLVDEKNATLADIGDWLGDIPEAALQTLGSAVGLSTGGPPAGYIGAGMGGVVGQYVKRGIGTVLSGMPFRQPTAAESALAAGAGVVGEGAGRFLSYAWRDKLRPEVRQAVDFFRQYGGELLPGQTKGGLWRYFENMLEASWGGMRAISEFKEKYQSKDVIDNMIEQVARKLGDIGDPVLAGELVQNALDRGIRTFLSVAASKYAAIDSLYSSGVPTAAIKEAAKRKLEELTTSVAEKEIPVYGSEAVVRYLKRVTAWPDTLSFGFLARNMSALYKAGFKPNVAVPGMEAGVARHLAGVIDETLNWAGSLLPEGAEAKAAWLEARRFYKEGVKIFNDKFIEKMSKLYPEEVVKHAFISPSRVEMLKKAVADEPEIMQELKGWWLADVLTKKATTAEQPSWRIMQRELNKLGDYHLSKIFTKDELADINNIVATLRTLQENAGRSGGSLVMQFAQAGVLGVSGVIGGITSGDLSALTYPAVAGAGIYFTSRGVAEIYSSKLGRKLIMEGLRTPPGTPAAMQIMSRLAAVAGEENIIRNRQRPEPSLQPQIGSEVEE